jgi:LPPG:FO 2-phospho-L-lactate transferase
MVTFLAGGTGTPKLLYGAEGVFEPADTPVVCNTGDDVELSGVIVCPDIDTVLFSESDRLDRELWWGIDDDSTTTHDEIKALADTAGLDSGPRYLPEDAQTAGREIARFRRFSGVAEFMELGDRDRAVHVTRTGLLDAGESLTDATETLATGLGVKRSVIPMSDDPVATIIHTADGPMHFQEFWVHHRGERDVERVEFRGAAGAEPTETVLDALDAPVVIGPSNPITSIGPMVAMDSFEKALESTPVVAVSPFIGERVFSGPAGKLLAASGYEPSTAGVAAAYPFVDAFVLDSKDGTGLDRPVVRTDTKLGQPNDGKRVSQAVCEAFGAIGVEVP